MIEDDYVSTVIGIRSVADFTNTGGSIIKGSDCKAKAEAICTLQQIVECFSVLVCFLIMGLLSVEKIVTLFFVLRVE